MIGWDVIIHILFLGLPVSTTALLNSVLKDGLKERGNPAIATPLPLSLRTRALHVPIGPMTQSNGFTIFHAMTNYPSAGSI
jgi:hypothetical protein